MVYHARRYRNHLEIRHLIGTDHHRTLLLTEGIHNLLQGICSAIYIVAVKLDSIFSTMLTMYREIPASAYAEVSPGRNYMNKSLATGSHFLQKFRCSVG